MLRRLLRRRFLTFERVRTLRAEVVTVSSRSRQVLTTPISRIRLTIIALVNSSARRSNVILNAGLVQGRLNGEQQGHRSLVVVVRGAVHDLHPFRSSM